MREPDFDMSADMRLLELQRNSLGLDAPERGGSWESRFAAESTPGIEPAEVSTAPQPMIVATLAAAPSGGVIAGAVITVSLAIANEGSAPANGVVAAVSMPGAASYRMGSYVRDGRPGEEIEADAFLNEGVPVGRLEAGARTTFIFKASVKLGNGPLLFTPHVRGERAPVTGAAAIRVERKAGAGAAFTSQIERVDAALYDAKPLIPVEVPADNLPIYELDPQEELEYEAADAALSSAVPQREAAPTPQASPQPSVATPPPPIAVSEPAMGIVLFGSFDRTTLAFFERTFAGSKAPTLLNHCVFGSALACALDARGTDRFRLREHLAAQSQILHRIALHEKLGRKEPIGEYAGAMIADVAALRAEALASPEQVPKGSLVLRCDVPEPTRVVLQRLNDERERWDFVKARQLALALQATGIECSNEGTRAKVDNALRHYAQAAMTMLQKLFVRLRIDRTTIVLSQNDAQADAAARALLAALSEAF